MPQFTIDAEALAAYGRHSAEVTDRLTTAAQHITTAADLEVIERLAADLGQISTDFTARVAAILTSHADVLSAAADLVTGYGHTLGQLGDSATDTDTGTATAVSRATHTIEGLV